MSRNILDAVILLNHCVSREKQHLKEPCQDNVLPYNAQNNLLIHSSVKILLSFPLITLNYYCCGR